MKATAIRFGPSAGHGVLKAGCTVAAPLAWTMAGLIYIAETGVNYNKLKKGLIDKKEFKKRAKYGAVGKVGAIVGSSIGGALGFLLGTAILPGIGSVVGVVVGGVSVSFAMSALTVKAVKGIDTKI